MALQDPHIDKTWVVKIFGSKYSGKVVKDIENLDFVKFLREDEQYGTRVEFKQNKSKVTYGRPNTVDVFIEGEEIGHLILEYLNDTKKGFASVRYVGCLPNTGDVVLSWVNPEYNQRIHKLYEEAGRPEGIRFP